MLEIPAHIEQAVSDAVTQYLAAELGDRGLLLSADGLAVAEADAVHWGARLLPCVIQRCYPTGRQGRALALGFDSERCAARFAAALAFGAVTARVLAPKTCGSEPAGSVELLCAMFNLGIGLVDGLCDEDAEAGAALLELVHGQDLVNAAEEPRGRNWLRAVLPPALADDYTAAFTVGITETFFETLHEVYPDDAWLQHRRGVGTQLAAALEAERRSVIRSDGTAREQLVECSRLTSVIPFEIIESLAGGNHAAADRSAGTLLGEAMWRIDDLVDLCQDARCGALNGVLLTTTQEPWHPGGKRGVVSALERLLASTDIPCLAAQAAERLLAGLQLAGGGLVAAHDHQPSLSFLYFIQNYAGIAPTGILQHMS